MSSKIYIKRTSVAGKVPTLSNINTGELALNLRDGRAYSSNGTIVFEIGANVHSLSVGNGQFSIANGTLVFPNYDGNDGEFLKTDGSGNITWGTAAGALGASFVSNSYFQPILANTNAYIASIANTSITSGTFESSNNTITFVRDDASIFDVVLTGVGEVTNTYVTSTYVTNSAFQSALANTNTYIATKTDDSTVLATNTALRALISDTIQVANLNATLADYWPSANVITYVNAEVAGLVNSAPSTLDTLNELAAALGDDENFATTVTTNLGQKLGSTASVTLTGDVSGSGSFSSNSLSISVTVDDSFASNANLQTEVGRVNLLNTNLTNTNTALRTLISDRMQVANVQALFSTLAANVVATTNVANYMTVANTQALHNSVTANLNLYIANTNALIDTKLDSSVITNYWPSANIISHVSSEISALVDSSPAALDTLNELAAALGDDANFSTTVTNSIAGKMSVANTQTLHNSITANLNSYIANTNPRIANILASVGSTNTALRTLVDDRMQVANVNVLVDDRMQVANVNVLVDDRMQVANTRALHASITANLNSFIANTNPRITNILSSINSTNTDLRVLIDDRMQVANVNTLVNDRLQVSNATLQFVTSTGNTTTHDISVGGLTVANSFSLPKVDGTANGQVLLTYANGTLYWGTAAAGGITTENNDKVIRSDEGFIILMDTDNDSSSTEFQVRKDSNLKTGGDLLFSVRSDGRAKFNDSFTLPNTDGNNGEALITDGSGGVGWGAVVSSDDLDDVISRNPNVSSNVFFNADTTANNFFVEGDLVVSGNITTISSEELNVDTSFIVLNANLTSSLPPILDAGIEVNRGNQANTRLYWDESGNRWHVTYGNALTDRAIPITLDDVLDNGFASNNGITINGVSNLADADITKLTINSEFTFPQEDGNSTQVLATYGNGALYWTASNNELRSAISMRQMNFTANTDQLFFNGTDDDGKILRYEVGKTSVYLNGIKLKLNIDYSAETGTSVTLTEKAANGDILMIDAFGYEDSVRFGNTSIIIGAEYSANSTSEQIIDSFSTTDYDSAQFIVKATDQGKIHMTTINCVYAFSNVHITEYGTLVSNGSLMTLDATYSSNVVSLKATPVTSTVKFKVHRTTLRNF